ncbi:ABC transporter substrate-binding protein [Paenibacillus ginsengarvi]|uniref:Extracellular solute-binding protein n=1 Tax=Paenibacillus ginsengarvi TaxID=400777 RepID=A0A3B0BDG4_9BACL|nr:extracellular solute-binding protein [Paenibacillus ginsengarvi]RKN70126.1 extracellular solute-binding protein [Paenibacillus ginsengarvi]
MKKKTTYTLALLSAITVALTACGGGGGSTASPGTDNKTDGKAVQQTPDTQKPAELSIYLGSMTKKELDEVYAPLIKEKFPNYTLIGVESSNKIGDLLAAGNVPDIIVGTKGTIPLSLQEFGIDQDISDLVKTSKFDLSRIEPAYLDQMKYYTNGKIIGIPINGPAFALHYNKTLFDKFGVAYPKDGMTWDDTYEIAKKLTRNEGGIQYRGYSERWHQMFMEFNQFSLPYLDAKEDKAAVNTDQWKTLINGFVRFYKLPGLKFDSKTGYTEEDLKVFATGTSGMQIFGQPDQFKTFDWDIVSVPTFKEKPNGNLWGSARFFFITNTSKNKEAAMNVSAFITSDEAQLKLSRKGYAPSLAKISDEMKTVFQQDGLNYKGKHVTSFFYNKPASEPPARAPGLVNFTKAQAIMIAEVQKMFTDGIEVDVNTALRNAEELINKGIAEQKATKK